jgi:hypothetical protein
MVKLAALALLVVAAACQGKGDEAAQPQPAPRDAKVAVVADAAGEVDAGVKLDEPEAPDPGKQLADMDAVPAWQAVIDRAQYLERRGQHGVAYGTLGPAVMVLGPPPVAPTDAGVPVKLPDAGLVPSELTWLVDDTEGNGALAIRAKLGAFASQLKEGERVALGGAWVLDEDRRWYWNVDGITKLPPLPPPKEGEVRDPPSPPGHDILVVDRIPTGSRTISVGREGDIVYFTVNGRPPAIDGEGWPVSDELGDPVYALLQLPGERPSFGAQDFRTPDERWQLRRGWMYAVRVGKLRKSADPEKPASMNAKTSPIRIK